MSTEDAFVITPTKKHTGTVSTAIDMRRKSILFFLSVKMNKRQPKKMTQYNKTNRNRPPFVFRSYSCTDSAKLGTY